jgi:hypothetical protein
MIAKIIPDMQPVFRHAASSAAAPASALACPVLGSLPAGLRHRLHRRRHLVSSLVFLSHP